MKKIALMASAVILAAACQKTEINKIETTPEDNSNEPVPVLFGLGQPDYDVAVKSTNSSGSLDRWGTNKLYIFGYNTQATEYTSDATLTDSDELSALIFNIGATTTKDESTPDPVYTQELTVTNPENSEPFYYQGNYTYDFYAYYVDDAAATVSGSTWEPNNETDPTPLVITTESATTPVDGVTLAKGVYIPFIIDGCQDLMTAEANKTIDEATETTTDEVDAEDCYSAYAARRGVQPNLQFKHLLTRLTFEIKPGSEASESVQVTDIIVKSNSKGFLGVVGADKGTIKALPTNEVTNPLADFTLMSRDESTGKCIDMPNVELTDNFGEENGVKAGESIMVMPGETSYEVTVKTTDPTITTAINDVVKEIKLSGEATAFKAGYSYNVVVTVYSLERVEVSATLTPWEDGEEINIGQDGDEKPSEQN